MNKFNLSGKLWIIPLFAFIAEVYSRELDFEPSYDKLSYGAGYGNIEEFVEYPSFLKDVPSDPTTDFEPNTDRDTEIAPYIFLLRPDARWATNKTQFLESELNKLTKKNPYDYTLRSDYLGTYFYTRSMTAEKAREFSLQHKSEILTVSRYSKHLKSISQKHMRQQSLHNRPQHILGPLSSTIRLPKDREGDGKTLSESTDLVEMRILCQPRLSPLPKQYYYNSKAGSDVHIFMIDTGANLKHKAFKESIKEKRINNRISTGPNPSKGPTLDSDVENFHGTAILGKLIGNGTGLAKHASVTIIRDVDEDFNRGIPLMLSALVKLFDVVRTENALVPTVINLPWQLQVEESGGSNTSERMMRWWISEIIAILGTFPNVILVCPASDSRNLKTTHWPASLSKKIKNMVVVGGVDNAGRRISSDANVWIYAPAQNISVPTSNNEDGYKKASGTALAAASISGILASYMSQFPYLTATGAKELLRQYGFSRNRDEFAPVAWNGVRSQERGNISSLYPNITSSIGQFGGVFPGYITVTEDVLNEVTLSSVSERVTTITEEPKVTVTETEEEIEVSVSTFERTILRESFKTRVATHTLTDVSTKVEIAPPPPPPPPGMFSELKCFGFEANKYIARASAVKYIENNFCKQVGGAIDTAEVECGRPFDGGRNCFFTQTAYKDTLGAFELGVQWYRSGLRPTEAGCVTALRNNIIDACDNENTEMVFNWKGGGKVNHGPEVQYWLKPLTTRFKPPSRSIYVHCFWVYKITHHRLQVRGSGWLDDDFGMLLKSTLKTMGCSDTDWEYHVSPFLHEEYEWTIRVNCQLGFFSEKKAKIYIDLISGAETTCKLKT